MLQNFLFLHKVLVELFLETFKISLKWILHIMFIFVQYQTATEFYKMFLYC